MSEPALQFWLMFLGWNSVINIGFLLLATALLIAMKSSIQALHSRLLGVSVSDLPALYFEYLGRYKLLIIVFNLVPYIVLRLIAS